MNAVAEREEWTISTDAQRRNVTVRIPTKGVMGSLFASIASKSIAVYSINAADGTDASVCPEPIRVLTLPFEITPEHSSARYEDGVLVLGLSRP